MVALTCKALIQAYEDYPSYANRDDIPDAIETAYNYIWGECWVPYDVGNPNSRAFNYNDRDVGSVDPPDLEPQPDLNGLIVPPMGWLYSVTGDPVWRERGDEVFLGTLTEYDEWGFWVRGPYFGASTGTSLSGKKQFNQTYLWSYKYIEWAEADIEPETQTIIGAGFTNEQTFGSGSFSQSIPTSISTDGWWVPKKGKALVEIPRDNFVTNAMKRAGDRLEPPQKAPEITPENVSEKIDSILKIERELREQFEKKQREDNEKREAYESEVREAKRMERERLEAERLEREAEAARALAERLEIQRKEKVRQRGERELMEFAELLEFIEVASMMDEN
jgi:hypothetical protein